MRVTGGFFRREAHPARRSYTTARSSILPLASSSGHSIWTCPPGVGESSSRSAGSVFVRVGVFLPEIVHDFGPVDGVPLGVVEVGQCGGEQAVFLAVDVVVQ